MRRPSHLPNIISIIGAVLFIAAIAVALVRAGRPKDIAVEEIDQSDSTLVEDTLDLSQNELIATEILKAKKNKMRKPKKYRLGEAGEISPYDSLFKIYAQPIGWDWRLLAAISYCESNFNPDAVSASGAKGLMQLMPRTAGNYGCPDSLMQDPEWSIKTGSMLLADLENRLRSKKNIDHDLMYFTIAGFHAGLGHIYDAIILADSLGYNPTLWHDNVEDCLMLKADPEYYNLPYVRLGRFNGKITSAYIKEVLDYYAAFKRAK